MPERHTSTLAATLRRIARWEAGYRLKAGTDLGPAHSVLALRERIHRGRDTGRGALTAETAQVITVWNSFRSGSNPSRAQPPKGLLTAKTIAVSR
jgi:hypothetical protein